MSDFTTFEFEERDHIATITLDRPHVMNSFNQVMLDEFAVAWKRCRLDDDIRVVVLQANGERAFSTGVDRVEGRKIFVSGRLSDGDTVLTDAEALFVLLKPGQP